MTNSSSIQKVEPTDSKTKKGVTAGEAAMIAIGAPMAIAAAPWAIGGAFCILAVMGPLALIGAIGEKMGIEID